MCIAVKDICRGKHQNLDSRFSLFKYCVELEKRYKKIRDVTSVLVIK